MRVFNKVLVNNSAGNTLYQLKPNLPLSFYDTGSMLTDFNVKNIHWSIGNSRLRLTPFWDCGNSSMRFQFECWTWNFYAITMNDLRDPTLPYPIHWKNFMRLQMYLEVSMDVYGSNDSYMYNAVVGFGGQAYYNKDDYPCVGEADLLNLNASTSTYLTFISLPNDPVYVKFKYFNIRPQVCLWGKTWQPSGAGYGFFTGQKGIATMHCPFIGAYNPNANADVDVTTYCNVVPSGGLSVISEKTISLADTDTKYYVNRDYNFGTLDFNSSIDNQFVNYRKQLTLL